MSSPSEDGPESAEELRAALRRALEENDRLRHRLAALSAETAAAQQEAQRRHERELAEVREAGRAELRAVTEEMAAAARFSETEWREERQRMEGCVRAAAATSLALLPREEAEARRAAERAEAAAFAALQSQAEAEPLKQLPPRDAYRLVFNRCRGWEEEEEAAAAAAERHRRDAYVKPQLKHLWRALDCTRESIQESYLGRTVKDVPGEYPDTSSPAHALWHLYEKMRKVGFPTDSALRSLLSTEAQVDRLLFNFRRYGEYYGDHNAFIDREDVCDFYLRMLRHLPNLQQLSLCRMPPLSTSPGLLDALAEAEAGRLPPAPPLACLHLYATPYTVADLHTARRRLPQLRLLAVDARECTDWGEYAGVEPAQRRGMLVNKACGGILYFDF